MNKITYKKLLQQKNTKPISCLTAYTKSIAKIIDGKIDIVLIGDSVGTALYGMKNTQSVTLDMLKNHGKAVIQNINKSLTIIDMPYKTYQNKYQALKNAKEMLNYTKANLIKLESNNQNIEIVDYLTKNKINVVGHIGVTPQKYINFKNIKIVGKTLAEEKALISLAIRLEKAGAKFIILECIKLHVAKKITSKLKIPTIGIGSSKYCDGQVLVINDLLNLDESEKKLRFVKKFINLNEIIGKVVTKYAKEVKNKKFPSKKHSYL